jgi:hypothetical protein
VITGIKGRGTAARGDDLADGSEIKSCSRADQLCECKKCGARVLVWQEECPVCNSASIKIKTDSHWIFPIKSESELSLLLDKVPRIFLVLFDNVADTKTDIRVRIWVVNPQTEYVKAFFTDYFENNYQKKAEPAPCNFHPLKFDFYMSRPVLVFEAVVEIERNDVSVKFWDLKNQQPEKMPTEILTSEEMKRVFPDFAKSGMTEEEFLKSHPFVPENRMSVLVMRKKTPKVYKEKYVRR